MTKCSITCMEPGCTNKIYYTVADKKECISFGMPNDEVSDDEVPLYCERHRTEEGRHSAVRKLFQHSQKLARKISDRERNKRLGLRYHVLGTPMDLIDVDDDAAPAGGGRG